MMLRCRWLVITTTDAAILDGMENQPKRDRPTGNYVLLIVGVLIAIPLMYCLSIGPASVLVSRGAVSVEGATVFYSPIVWAVEGSPFLQKAYMPYVLWWHDITGTAIEGR